MPRLEFEMPLLKPPKGTIIILQTSQCKFKCIHMLFSVVMIHHLGSKVKFLPNPIKKTMGHNTHVCFLAPFTSPKAFT